MAANIAFGYGAALKASVRALAKAAFEEDLGEGDVTAEVLGLAGRSAEARVFCREPVSFCGAFWYQELLKAFHDFTGREGLQLTCEHHDGQRLEKGSTLFRLSGDTADILAFERPFLNFLGRAIGIANTTNTYVSAIRRHNSHTRILDTRKTLPGYRFFDKYAVLCGGGDNHRLHLGDQVLIKENHIAKLSGVSQALEFVRQRLQKPVAIEIEVRNMDELHAAIAAACPIIMLDNFTPDMVRQACELPRETSLLEVSGGITLDNIDTYAHEKLDRISIGALTHSVLAPDLSLLMREV